MRICTLLFLVFGFVLIKFDSSAASMEFPLTIAATGKLLINIDVNHQSVPVIIDTGSPAFLLIDEQIVDKENIEKRPVRTALRFFAEDRGEATYRVVLPDVRIGPFEYANVQALTLNDIRRATGTGYLDLPNFWAQGILGMGFLEHFHVKINYPHSTLTLVYNDESAQTSAFSRLAPTLPVGLSDKTLPFLLDTGSTFSIVSEKAMDALGFKFTSIQGQTQNRLFQGTAQTDRINIGPLTYSNLTFEVAAHFEEYAESRRLAGIIGYDVLKDLILDLDFPRRTIQITRE